MKRITRNPISGICVFLHSRRLLFIAFALLLILSSTIALAADQANVEELPSQTKNEPVYIMPDQPESPLKFGVAITPDQNFRSMNYQFFSTLEDPFADDHHGTQRADVSTVVRVALDEFKFFSGFNHWVHGVEETVNGYSRKLKLTGELNLNKKNADPMDYIEKVNFVAEIYKADDLTLSHRSKIKSIFSQFEVNRVTWNLGIHISSPQILFKLGIGDAIIIQSSAGEDMKIGAMIKLTI